MKPKFFIYLLYNVSHMIHKFGDTLEKITKFLSKDKNALCPCCYKPLAYLPYHSKIKHWRYDWKYYCVCKHCAYDSVYRPIRKDKCNE